MQFSPEQVVEAYRRARPKSKKSVAERWLDGEASSMQTLCFYSGLALVALAFLLILHFCLALLVFFTAALSVPGSSGVLVDSSYKAPVSAARSVELRPLWDYPSLSLEQLRRVQDIVFVHNQAYQVLRAGAIVRKVGGAVSVRAMDGSIVQVEPSGHSFWRRPGQPEVQLTAMDTWRAGSHLTGAEAAWLTSGALETQRAV